jgi:hypothetical protein
MAVSKTGNGAIAKQGRKARHFETATHFGKWLTNCVRPAVVIELAIKKYIS